MNDGSVKCWGYNGNGQLGDATTTDRNVPTTVIGLTSGANGIAAGNSHTCIVSTGGAVRCWGYNLNGQLGNNAATTQSSAPVNVTNMSTGVATVVAGGNHTCAVTLAGGAKCWGENAGGAVGDGSFAQRNVPVDVAGFTSGVAAITAGASHGCAIATSGALKCWGTGTFGQLGEDFNTVRNVPVNVVGFTFDATSVKAGIQHTCAKVADNSSQCWGDNDLSEIGDTTLAQRLTPAHVQGLSVLPGGSSRVTAITVGNYHSCAIDRSGGVHCWGWNIGGQLGDNTDVNRSTPIPVSGLSSGVVAVGGGMYHTCALTIGGGMKCWGSSGDGQLGDGTTVPHFSPADVPGLTSGVVAMSAGHAHNCVVTAAGGVKCWGYNNTSALGDGTNIARYEPVDVVGLASGVAAVAAAHGHTCALTTVGGVKCWGANGSGQLGDGTNFDRSTPVDVSGLSSGVVAIATGGDHTCALTTTGGVKCWGSNAYGQLAADAATFVQLRPGDVIGLTTGVASITTGYAHTCAQTTSGYLMCWGNNSYGQLGDNTAIRRSALDYVFGFGPRPTLVSSTNVASVAQSVTYTLNITGNSPTGTVEFKANGIVISGCGSVAVAGGVATCTTSYEGNGIRIITANYSGDAANSRSMAALAGGQVVTNTFSVVASAGPNGTLTPGGTRTVAEANTSVFTVTPNSGYGASMGGTCGGNLAGNTYTTNPIIANCSVVATFAFIAVKPDAPTIGIIQAGDRQVTVNFTPPAFNGGATISSYTATCGALSATGAASPLIVTGLNNFSTYDCAVIATNSVGNSLPSSSVSATPLPPIALGSVVSRKIHGSRGPFAIAIDTTAAIGGAVTVEPRAIGTGHEIIFAFNVPISTVGVATVVDAALQPVGTATPTPQGSNVVVLLTGVPDKQRLTISLAGVNGAGTFSAPMGFLLGDVNGTRAVDSVDVSSIKSRSGQITDTGNFHFDINASGSIGASDVAGTKAHMGSILP
ncbi:MAG: Ig-like domain repeat protein [Betaproteobacteria bacterium]|nr:Ig-like domain repeat protein [Betaproteobacteria bacterium]